MLESQDKPEISDAVRLIMPDASEEELIEATDNFREFLKELYEIFMSRDESWKRFEEMFPPEDVWREEP